jgi:iron complex transport system substrate-binding protein
LIKQHIFATLGTALLGASKRHFFPPLTSRNDGMRLFAITALLICMTNQSEGSTDVLKDDLGREWLLKEHPISIASTFLAGDEILSELVKGSSVRFIASSTLADNSEYSNIVDLAKLIPFRVGSSPEAIAKINPDLIFMASWNSPSLSNIVSKLKIKTFTLSSFNSIDDIERNILLMGKVLHLEDNARRMVVKMQQSMPIVPHLGKKILTYDPSGVTLGKKTIFDSLISRLGLSNVISEEGWPKTSPEWIARSGPDFIVSNGELDQFPTILALISKTPGWRELSPVKNRKIVLIPNRLLTSASQYIALTYNALSSSISKLEKSK